MKDIFCTTFVLFFLTKYKHAEHNSLFKVKIWSIFFKFLLFKLDKPSVPNLQLFLISIENILKDCLTQNIPLRSSYTQLRTINDGMKFWLEMWRNLQTIQFPKCVKFLKEAIKKIYLSWYLHGAIKSTRLCPNSFKTILLM